MSNEKTTSQYKALIINLHDAPMERQVYVTEANVTEEQILGGDDTGVVCLLIDESLAELIVARLNGQPAADDD